MEIVVASTTDTQKEIERVAGIQAEEPEVTAPPPQPEPEAEPEPAAAAEPEPKPLSKSASQRRWDAMTRRIKELERQVSAQQPAPRAEQPQPATEAAPAEQTPASKPRPKQEDFQTWEEYDEARIRWTLEQVEVEKAKKAAEAAAQQEAQAIQESWKQQMEAAATRYDDLAETLSADVPIYPAVLEAIKQLPNGVAVAYFLGKHRDVADDLLNMNPVRAVAEVGRLSFELGDGITETDEPTSGESEPTEEEEPAPPAQAAPPRQRSNAPAPIRPVSGSATKSSVPMDELSYAEYRRIRDQQVRNRYRR